MKRSMDRTASPIAAMVVVAILLATACTAGQEAASGAPEATTRASATPAPSATASPVGASTSPSASTGLLGWSPASLDHDWPAPVRAEPAGGAHAVPILWTDDGETGRYQDPTDDIESDAFPWVDIHAVAFCRNRECPVVWVPGAPNVDPAEQWMAYGLVADDDGDGVADRRFRDRQHPRDRDGPRATSRVDHRPPHRSNGVVGPELGGNRRWSATPTFEPPSRPHRPRSPSSPGCAPVPVAPASRSGCAVCRRRWSVSAEATSPVVAPLAAPCPRASTRGHR